MSTFVHLDAENFYLMNKMLNKILVSWMLHKDFYVWEPNIPWKSELVPKPDQ